MDGRNFLLLDLSVFGLFLEGPNKELVGVVLLEIIRDDPESLGVTSDLGVEPSNMSESTNIILKGEFD